VLLIKNANGRFSDMSETLISRDSSVSIVTRLLAGSPRYRGSIRGRGKRIVQTGAGAHPPSYLRGTGDKATGA
jgi:hypothetical protein